MFSVIQIGPYDHKVRMRALAAGVIACGGQVVHTHPSPACIAQIIAERPVRFAFTCGMKRCEEPAREVLDRRGLPLLVLDLGYFRRANGPFDLDGYNQLGLGRLCWTPPVTVPADRFERLGLTVAPRVSRPGRPIALVLGQVPGDTQHGLEAGALSTWLTARAHHFSDQGFEIYYRPHPKAPRQQIGIHCEHRSPSEYTLDDDLRVASVAITYNSTSGLEALMAGIPVDCAPCAHYAHVADLRDPAALREHLHRLAAAQWTIEELQSGEALRFMNRFAPLLPS